MSYAERLAKQLEQAPQREVFNATRVPYQWKREANEKRGVR